MDRTMRREEVLKICGLSRSILYDMVRDGSFPSPVRLGRRAVGGRETEVAEWLESRPPASESGWK